MTTTETKTKETTSVHQLSIETCIKAVSKSLVMGRKSLHTELAVCLSIFAGAKNTSVETKAMVAEVYSKAGYDYTDSKSRQYKTVNRRVNASAALFDKLGAEVVNKWIGETKEAEMIEAVGKGLGEYKFDSMDDVLDFAGRESNKSRKASAGAGAAKEKGQRGRPAKEKVEVPMHKFNVARVHVEIPQSMASGDMVKLAAKILAVARQKEQEELKAAVAQPSAAMAPIAAGAGEAPVVH